MLITTRYLSIKAALNDLCHQLLQQTLPLETQDRIEHYLKYQRHDRKTFLPENLRYLQAAFCRYLQTCSDPERTALVFAGAQLITYCYPKNASDSQNGLLSPVHLRRIGHSRLYYSSTGYWVPAEEILTFATVVTEPLSQSECEAMAMHLTTQRPRWRQVENAYLKWHVLVVLFAILIQQFRALCLPPAWWPLSLCPSADDATAQTSAQDVGLLNQLAAAHHHLLNIYSLVTLVVLLGGRRMPWRLWARQALADFIAPGDAETPRGMASILTPGLDQLPSTDIREYNQHLTEIKQSQQTAQQFRFSSGEGK